MLSWGETWCGSKRALQIAYRFRGWGTGEGLRRRVPRLDPATHRHCPLDVSRLGGGPSHAHPASIYITRQLFRGKKGETNIGPVT
jgi:hypothetical protein